MGLVTVAALHAALLGSDSATAVLEHICGAPVRVRRLAPPVPPPSPTAMPATAETAHRRVALLCGGRELSRADLWFRPAALTPAMARALAETDEPFGRVVRPLGLRRHTLCSRAGAVDDPVALEHRALLRTPQGVAVAEVWERYGWGLVAGS